MEISLYFRKLDSASYFLSASAVHLRLRDLACDVWHANLFIIYQEPPSLL